MLNSMGNNLAFAMILLWPLLAIYIYRAQSIQVATLWVIIGGFMLLPVKTSINLPMIPAMGKESIPVLSSLIGVFWVKKQKIYFTKNLGKVKFLVLLLITAPFISALLNADEMYIGGQFLKGLNLYDGLALMVNQMIPIMAFFIGRQFFKTYEHQLLIFKTLVIAGLFYSILMLFEVRMSPQLHTWIYGYFPHDFGQQIRFGGFRPVVFMGHGLLVSFFAAIVLISSIALWSINVKVRGFIPAWVSYYLLFILLLCKSAGPFLYGIFGFFVIKILSPKIQMRIAVMLVSLAMLYPIMSMLKVFPHQALVNTADSISSERAQSLNFRFNNESKLLGKASERILFGWGGWARNRVYDAETGKDISITDGGWIITFGMFGFMGFVAEFGLLAVSVLLSMRAAKLLKVKREQSLLSSHAILIGIIMVNQLPNNALAPWLWLLVGALFGRSEQIINSRRKGKLILPTYS
ncbi:hypothetical protein [uncultured Cycloclasticus sp.]|uniref:hypothetical protein n=1 Tax=uncultured Cycloclasticus sp. TaxID=172194 RepID=UPI0025891221|nr:hypothetical protein [uncultured Cycloclasticus sp.]